MSVLCNKKFKKDILRAIRSLRKNKFFMKKSFNKNVDSSLKVYYTISELEREVIKVQRKELIKFRKESNKTQEEMSKRWGITLSFYKQIECGAKNPSIQKVKDFKKAFPKANTDKIFLD